MQEPQDQNSNILSTYEIARFHVDENYGPGNPLRIEEAYNLIGGFIGIIKPNGYEKLPTVIEDGIEKTRVRPFKLMMIQDLNSEQATKLSLLFKEIEALCVCLQKNMFDIEMFKYYWQTGNYSSIPINVINLVDNDTASDIKDKESAEIEEQEANERGDIMGLFYASKRKNSINARIIQALNGKLKSGEAVEIKSFIETNLENLGVYPVSYLPARSTVGREQIESIGLTDSELWVSSFMKSILFLNPVHHIYIFPEEQKLLSEILGRLVMLRNEILNGEI